MTVSWQLVLLTAAMLAVVGMSSTTTTVSAQCVKEATCGDCINSGTADFCEWSSDPQGGCGKTSCDDGPQAVCVPATAKNCTKEDLTFAALAGECRLVGKKGCKACNEHTVTLDGFGTSQHCVWADVPEMIPDGGDADATDFVTQCHYLPPKSPFKDIVANTGNCTANKCDLVADGDCESCLAITGCSYSRYNQCYFGACDESLKNELGYSCQYSSPGFQSQAYCTLRSETEVKADLCHLRTKFGCSNCTTEPVSGGGGEAGKYCQWRPAGNLGDGSAALCVADIIECNQNAPTDKLCVTRDHCPADDGIPGGPPDGDSDGLGGGYIFLIILFVFTVIGVTAWFGKRYVDQQNGLQLSSRQLVDAGKAGGPTASSTYGSY